MLREKKGKNMKREILEQFREKGMNQKELQTIGELSEENQLNLICYKREYILSVVAVLDYFLKKDSYFGFCDELVASLLQSKSRTGLSMVASIIERSETFQKRDLMEQYFFIQDIMQAKHFEQLSAMLGIVISDNIYLHKLTYYQISSLLKVVESSVNAEEVSLIEKIATDEYFLQQEELEKNVSGYNVPYALATIVLKCKTVEQTRALDQIFFDDNLRREKTIPELDRIASYICLSKPSIALTVAEVAGNSDVLFNRNQESYFDLLEKLGESYRPCQLETMKKIATNQIVLEERSVEEQLQLMDAMLLIDDEKVIHELESIALNEEQLVEHNNESQLSLMQLVFESHKQEKQNRKFSMQVERAIEFLSYMTQKQTSPIKVKKMN